MKVKQLFFLVLCILPLVFFAQHKGNVNYIGTNARAHQTASYTSPVITLKVDALMNAKATTYTAVFNISQVGETSDGANTLMNNRINTVKEGLLALGLTKEAIHIDMISFVPVYEIEVEKKFFSKTYNEVPKGFEIQKNLHINFLDDEKFQEIITLCAKNEIYNLIKVDYFVDNLEKVYTQLQSKALDIIKSKKEFYTSIGIDFDKYDMVFGETRNASTPHQAYSKFTLPNSISVDALHQKKGLTRVKKPTSTYYNPISYKRFDAVINPTINEPVVQFTLSLQMQFTPKPKEVKTKEVIKETTKYYMITPEGNFKQLKLAD